MGGVRDAAGARLGTLVQEHRRAAGLTQRQLAQLSGLSVAAVRNLEQGRSRRPRRGSLDALARVLGLDVRQLAALAAAGDAARPTVSEPSCAKPPRALPWPGARQMSAAGYPSTRRPEDDRPRSRAEATLPARA